MPTKSLLLEALAGRDETLALRRPGERSLQLSFHVTALEQLVWSITTLRTLLPVSFSRNPPTSLRTKRAMNLKVNRDA